MKLITYRYKTQVEETIEQHFERLLDSQREGVAESARDIADNAVRALARLVRLLAEKDMLTAEEVLIVSDGYSHEPASFSK